MRHLFPTSATWGVPCHVETFETSLSTCHILNAEIKRPVFRKLKSYEIMNFSLILPIEFLKKNNYGSSDNEKLKIWQKISTNSLFF